ncbi:MAG: PqiC family protein [Desulfovibrionaceae bacterium]|nr:PqiC family protein [Desulfovibrionaceae bacterium]
MRAQSPSPLKAAPARSGALRCLALCLLCLSLLGCGISRPTDFYLLDGTSDPLSVPHMPRTTLTVEQIVLPGYLDRSGIVIRDDGGSGLNVASFNVWGEPLEQGVHRVLVNMLTAPLLQHGITVLPYQSANFGIWYHLYVEVLRLDADRSGRVVLEARWTLVDRTGNKVLDRGSFAAEERLNMPEFGSDSMFNAVVGAESRLLQQMGRDLAERLCAVAKPAAALSDAK